METTSSTDATALLNMPDQVLLLVLAIVSPQSLGRLCMVCRDLARLAQEEALWAAHCAAVRLSAGGDEGSSRTQYARYVVRLCYECRRPTPYQFKLLSRRLCEDCEKGHPHRYALATARQLRHAKSAWQTLSAAQQRALLPLLPGLDIKGFRWYLRASAIERAEEVLGDAGAEEEVGEEEQSVPPLELPPPDARALAAKAAEVRAARGAAAAARGSEI